MSLPLILSDNSSLNQVQTRWKSEIDPVLKNPFVNGLMLSLIPVISGTNVINHLLGRMMQGWTLIDINGSFTVYRSADFSNLTLTLTSNGAGIISLWVF